MIKLTFTFDREILIFQVNNKVITYFDRKWLKGINFIPKDENFIKIVLFSRNRISNKIVQWINEANSGRNLKEWQGCRNDEEVSKFIIKDARLKACVLRGIFKDDKQIEEKDLDIIQEIKNGNNL